MDIVKLKLLNATFILIVAFVLCTILFLMYRMFVAQRDFFTNKLRSVDAGLLANLSEVPNTAFYTELSKRTILDRLSKVGLTSKIMETKNLLKESDEELSSASRQKLQMEIQTVLNNVLQSGSESVYKVIRFVPIHIFNVNKNIKHKDIPPDADIFIQAHVVVYRESKMYALAFDINFLSSVKTFNIVGIETLEFTGYINESDAIGIPGNRLQVNERQQAYAKNVVNFESDGTIIPKDTVYSNLILQQQAYGLKQDRGLTQTSTR